MLELESRLIATNVVEALRAKGATVREITVEPLGRGARVRVEMNGPVVQCDLPAGHFAYARVADALLLATQACALETE